MTKLIISVYNVIIFKRNYNHLNFPDGRLKKLEWRSFVKDCKC